MLLKQITVERYKAYGDRCEFKIRPVTILVGRNNSGKSALARVVPLIAAGLLSGGNEPLPLEAGGLRHATTLHDLITNRAAHGSLAVRVEWEHESVAISLDATVRAFTTDPGAAPLPIVETWTLTHGANTLDLRRHTPLDPTQADYSLGPESSSSVRITWEGLWPRAHDHDFSDWVRGIREIIQGWARGVRYLCAPRAMPVEPFRTAAPMAAHRVDGGHVPMQLASDETLQDAVDRWFQQIFSVGLEVAGMGEVTSLRLRRDTGAVDLAQGGQGLTQVLPVVALAVATSSRGDGVDLVEHPEADLHPAAHGDVADLLLKDRVASGRPLIMETHSEMLLLRVRRQVAEGQLSPDDVAIYWVQQDQGRARLQPVVLHRDGSVDNWPDGVFYEDYDEILAIRRASRQGEAS